MLIRFFPHAALRENIDPTLRTTGRNHLPRTGGKEAAAAFEDFSCDPDFFLVLKIGRAS